MKRLPFILILASMIASCGKAAPTATPTSPESSTATVTSTPLPPTETLTPTLTPTPLYPPEGVGPSNFPSDVDPLTGLTVADPTLLNRRPMLVKVCNLPRTVRPQWGLSLADLVYEYYTEAGSTRFAAIFYGQDAETVGPIRSGRFFDANLVRGYKAIFALSGGYIPEMQRFNKSEFANRMVYLASVPNSPLYRYDPNGYDYLLVNTANLSAYFTQKGIENGRQNLDGMFFKLEPPTGSQSVTQVFLRYSGSIYNRWDYDPTTGKYLRFVDNAEDLDQNNEVYVQLTDRLTNQPITADNVVVLFVDQEIFSTDSKGNHIYDILFSGSGNAYAFRDGQVYQVKWHRNDTDVVSLTSSDGTSFPFKPGTTWFEVVGQTSTLEQTDQGWHFTHMMP